MPLYDYKCDRCGEVFEVRQKFADEPLRVHEECGGEVHRLLSPSALQFKGSGWYITDYAKSGSGKSSDTSGNGSPSKESKPASDTSSKTSDTKSSSSETKSS